MSSVVMSKKIENRGFNLDRGSYTNHVATKGERGVPQKTTKLHNSYLVKVATLGGGGF